MHASGSDRFFHPWHSLSCGAHAPVAVNGIIEIQQGSKAKYELDKETGFLRLDRILASHLRYPFHYGFIPQTFCEDNDPLDILIICSEQLIPLSIVEARVIGVVKMIDGGQQDDKIIAVAANDPHMKQINTLTDLDEDTRGSLRHFFEEYKKPEGKEVHIEELRGHKDAQAIVQESIERYRTHFR